MSRADFDADWTPYRDALITTFPNLTEDQIADADGAFDPLARKIALAQGLSEPEARAALDALLGGPMPADAYAAPQHIGAAIQGSEQYIPDGEDTLADDARFGDDQIAEPPTGRSIE